MKLRQSFKTLALKGTFPLVLIVSLTPQRSLAGQFDVYCISDRNNVLSCQRQNGLDVSCIINSDGTYACRNSQGQTFNCIPDSRGVISCQGSEDFSGVNSTAKCTVIGDGFSTCSDPLSPLPPSQWQFNNSIIRDTKFELPSVIQTFELSPN